MNCGDFQEGVKGPLRPLKPGLFGLVHLNFEVSALNKPQMIRQIRKFIRTIDR